MIGFAKIEKAALKRIGQKELDDRFKHRIQPLKSAAALRKVTDDRYLSLIGLRIFRAGLKHDMVDAKCLPSRKRSTGSIRTGCGP